MSYKIDIVNQLGIVINTVALTETVFADQYVNDGLMYDFVRMQQANARVAIASTKNRWEINGSNKKLYKQKGNGTWRVGDKKSPLRKKWWVARWPRSDRNFSIDMPKKMRKAALKSALSLKASSNSFLVLDVFLSEKPSTKKAIQFLDCIRFDRSTLVVVDNDLELAKSYRNISSVDVVDAAYISVFDLLKAKKVLFIGSALDKVVEIAQKR